MGVGVGTILRRYAIHALRNPSAAYRAAYPDLTFRPSIAEREGINGPGAVDGQFATGDVAGAQGGRRVGTDGTNGGAYFEATGAVVVRVNYNVMDPDRSIDLAHRYGQAAVYALDTGRYWSFTDDRGTYALQHFAVTPVGGNHYTIQLVPAVSDRSAYYLVVVQTVGSATPTA